MPGRAERLYGGRVVDQYVDAARGEHGRRRLAALLLVGQVGWHHADPPARHALLQQQGTGLVQARRCARAGPRRRRAAQRERDRAADAWPGTGDQRGLAGEVSCHCGLLNG